MQSSPNDQETRAHALSRGHKTRGEEGDLLKPDQRHSPDGPGGDHRAAAQDLARFLSNCVENLADTHRSHTLLKEISRKLDRLLERSDVSSTSGALMSVKDAARFLALSERAIRNRIATRAWPAYRYGTAVRVNPHELKALMRETRT